MGLEKELHTAICRRGRGGHGDLGGHEAAGEIESSVAVRQQLLGGGDVTVWRTVEESLGCVDGDVGIKAETAPGVDLPKAGEHGSQPLERSAGRRLRLGVTWLTDHPAEVLPFDLFGGSTRNLGCGRLHEVKAENGASPDTSEEWPSIGHRWQCVHLVEQLTETLLEQGSGGRPLQRGEHTGKRLGYTRRRKRMVRPDLAVEPVVISLCGDGRDGPRLDDVHTFTIVGPFDVLRVAKSTLQLEGRLDRLVENVVH